MEKWADYLIFAVKTNPNQTHIDSVEVHSDFRSPINETLNLTRTDIINNIKKGFTYTTVYKTKTGKLRKGENIYLTNVNGQEYLRTDTKNNAAADNFDNVPEL
jgi:hypothetical protein